MLFEWDEETKLTTEQMKEVEDAKKCTILYDEDGKILDKQFYKNEEQIE